MEKTDSAVQYFNENWKKYQSAITEDTLYHRELSAILSSFLSAHIGDKSFSFVDAGCGDGSVILPVLNGKKIDNYIGIDAAEEVLKLARQDFAGVNFKHEFICDNMLNGVENLHHPVDVIFSSYALHHLSYEDKVRFIGLCKDKLCDQGYLLLVDGVLKSDQTRAQWLDELQNRIKTTQQLEGEELQNRMQHPRSDDFPEEIATFEKIAAEQGWKDFSVLLEKDICAFMVFAKDRVDCSQLSPCRKLRIRSP